MFLGESKKKYVQLFFLWPSNDVNVHILDTYMYGLYISARAAEINATDN
jgi:hypothetical protein